MVAKTCIWLIFSKMKNNSEMGPQITTQIGMNDDLSSIYMTTNFELMVSLHKIHLSTMATF